VVKQGAGGVTNAAMAKVRGDGPKAENSVSLGLAPRTKLNASVSDTRAFASASLPMAELKAVSNAEQVHGLITTVRQIHLSPEIRRYAVELVSATRRLSEVRLGCSPRSTLHLVRACRAQAALAGRDYVVPDDLQLVAIPVLAHRLVLSAEAQAARRSAPELVRALLQRIPIPHGSTDSAAQWGAGIRNPR